MSIGCEYKGERKTNLVLMIGLSSTSPLILRDLLDEGSLFAVDLCWKDRLASGMVFFETLNA
jgi:hypothetical protein